MTRHELPRRRGRLIGWGLTVAVAVAAGGLLARAQGDDVGRANPGASGEARFELSQDPDRVVVRFTERLGELEADDFPTLWVYADGRVVRHRPSYMVRHGDFTGQLSDDELVGLVRSLSRAGLFEFDAAAVRAATRQVRQARGIETLMTDPSTIEIEVRLDAYQPAKSAAVQRDVRTVVTWTGLRYDARTYPEVAGVQNLQTVFLQLTELAERVDATGPAAGGAR